MLITALHHTITYSAIKVQAVRRLFSPFSALRRMFSRLRRRLLASLLSLGALQRDLSRLVVLLHARVNDLELTFDPGGAADPLADALFADNVRYLFLLSLKQAGLLVYPARKCK